MDPFACYFRNVALTESGEYKTQSREECKNNACRICDQYFAKVAEDRIGYGEEDVAFELDDALADIVIQTVQNSY